MKLKGSILLSLFLAAATMTSAQTAPVQPQPYDPNAGMAYDIARIAASVQAMTKTLKDFVDKFAKVEGVALNEKQQKLVMGMQLLIQAEQRMATLQKFQIELVEKDGQLRSRLAQVENDLNPQNIDRSVAFEGSTQTPEIKETRRRALVAERASLQSVLQQMQSHLQTVGGDVREAQNFVYRLRRTYLPQVERELGEQ
jgi:hypothetical protein